MKTVLLTGGTGFIGSHTAVTLIENGLDVVIVDDLSNSSRSVLASIEKITSVRPKFYKGNVASKRTLDRIFSENKIDAVIHFAGYKAVGESVAKPLMYYRNNLDTTVTLLEKMLEHKIYNLVYSSSATVYAEDNPPGRLEDMKLCCSNPYGWTKYMCEQIIRDTCAANPDFKAVILRYFNPVGAHESGLLGERPQGIPNNLMPYIQQVAVRKLPQLNVFGNDYETVDGTGVRDYIHVMDLAEAHYSAIEYLPKCRGAEEFNIGTGHGYSVLQMVNTFSSENNIEIPYVIKDRRPGDLPEYYANPARANRVLHWKARRGLKEICRDAYRWQRNISGRKK